MRKTDPSHAREMIGPAITDVAGEPAGKVQLDRLVARYHWAATYAVGSVVLEVACGTGQGLGLLSSLTPHVYGCDLSAENLSRARNNCGSQVPLIQADAESLPFAEASVDVVLLLETLYFLPSPDLFFSEAARILRPGGVCLISVINRDCPDFNPNHPLYFNTYGVRELSAIMRKHGFEPKCSGIIPMDAPTLRARIFKPLKRAAIRLNLIPESMQARLLLKRLVFGRLKPMPLDVRVMPAPAVPPTPLASDKADPVHQVVLCAGTRV